MKRTTTALRELIAQPGIIVCPGCYDPFSAKVAERVGFKMVSLGGFSLGASLATSEPLMNLEDVVRVTRYVTQAIDIPLKVDADAGFGEPLHVIRTVREFESAGAAGVHIEDQIYPKRAHYHKGVEHVIPVDEMIAKLKAAQQARRDPDFVIQARTDAMRTDGFDEGVRRANLFLEAGADLVYVFPNNEEEARQAPKEIAGPVTYLNSEGNLLGRPLFTHKALEDMGYKIVAYAILPIQGAAKGIRELMEKLYQAEGPVMGHEEALDLKQYIQDVIGLDKMYKIEEETVEHSQMPATRRMHGLAGSPDAE